MEIPRAGDLNFLFHTAIKLRKMALYAKFGHECQFLNRVFLLEIVNLPIANFF